LLSHRVGLLLELPGEKLDRLIVEAQAQAIGEVGTSATSVDGGGR
jgi:hypothetical protein